ncbi:MAG: EI24 domain-containing protein [Alphaproteobacteria bacterium]
METLIFAFARALRSLFAPGMIRVFCYSVLLTIVVLCVFWVGASNILVWLFDRPAAENLPFDIMPLIITGATGILAWFLFPGIMPVIVNFFDDKIANIIERQDYPHSQPIANPAFWPEFWHDAKFSLTVLGINLLVLPLYLIPVINAILFYWLNGYLLGKEFFIMTARRHIPLIEAKKLWGTQSRTITVAGIALTFMATLPVFNLFAPFWGIAVMTHIYHRNKQGVEILPPYR